MPLKGFEVGEQRSIQRLGPPPRSAGRADRRNFASPPRSNRAPPAIGSSLHKDDLRFFTQRGPEPRRAPANATTLRRGLISTEYLYVSSYPVHWSIPPTQGTVPTPFLFPRSPSLKPKISETQRL